MEMLMKLTPWKPLREKILLDEYGKKIVKKIFLMPDGKERDWNLKVEKNACCILPLTSDSRVILARQFRPGPGKILDELPGGYIEETDDNPESSVLRELIEETGYSGDVKFVGTCFDDAYSTLIRYCYVAINCRKIKEVEYNQDEFVEIKEVEITEFRKKLRSGEMTDIEVGYLCLDFLDLLK